MDKKFCVYIHTFPNGKVYIGITSRKPCLRWGCNGNRYRANLIKNAILKYGWDNIGHYVVEENLSRLDAENLEIELIKSNKSNSTEYGYNSSSGGSVGCLGYKHTEEEKQKIKDGLKTTYPHRGRKLSEEQKEKLRISHIGQVAWNKGMIGCFPKTKEEIEKRKATIKERYPDNILKKLPIHYVVQMDLNDNIIKIWDNVNQAERSLKFKNVGESCKTKKRTVKGFKFRYIEDVDKMLLDLFTTLNKEKVK